MRSRSSATRRRANSSREASAASARASAEATDSRWLRTESPTAAANALKAAKAYVASLPIDPSMTNTVGMMTAPAVTAATTTAVRRLVRTATV